MGLYRKGWKEGLEDTRHSAPRKMGPAPHLLNFKHPPPPGGEGIRLIPQEKSVPARGGGAGPGVAGAVAAVVRPTGGALEEADRAVRGETGEEPCEGRLGLGGGAVGRQESAGRLSPPPHTKQFLR